MISENNACAVVLLAFSALFSNYSLAQTPCDSTLVISGWIFQGEDKVVPASMAVGRVEEGQLMPGTYLVYMKEASQILVVE